MQVFADVVPTVVLPPSAHGVTAENVMPLVPPTFTGAVGDIEQPSAKFGHLIKSPSNESISLLVIGVPFAHAAKSCRRRVRFAIC
jgi:hypothetical protein